MCLTKWKRRCTHSSPSLHGLGCYSETKAAPPRMLIFSSLKWGFCLLTPHGSCLVSFQRPPLCTNQSSLIKSEPPCPCNSVFYSFGPSSSHVSLRSQLVQADRINSLLMIVLPRSLCASVKASIFCAPSNRNHGRVGRGILLQFFMMASGHPASIMPLPETCFDIFGLHPVGRKSCRLPFFQSWEEANLFMKESCPLLQAWKPSEGPDSSKCFLIDSLEIL